MKASFFKSIIVQNIIRLFAAFSFVLFIGYQVYLAVNYEESRIGRLIGIGMYSLITLASFFALSERGPIRLARTIMLAGGLMGLLILRMLNLPYFFGNPKAVGTVTDLNRAVYILTQLATLVLLVGYLIHKSPMKLKPRTIVTIVLESAAIIMYLAILIIESVLILKYRANVDFSVKITLLSRILYFCGFVGTAVSIMLIPPKIEEQQKEGRYIYSEVNEDEIDLVI